MYTNGTLRHLYTTATQRNLQAAVVFADMGLYQDALAFAKQAGMFALWSGRAPDDYVEFVGFWPVTLHTLNIWAAFVAGYTEQQSVEAIVECFVLIV